MPRGVRKHALTLLLAALLAVGLAACGSDDSTTGATTASGAESSQNGENGAAAFREPGGDNSIQNYGEEADATEREEAGEALAAYMAARAERDWDTACPYLAEAAVKPLEEFAKPSSKLKGKDCAQLLSVITAQTPADTFESTLTGPVSALRVKGDRAFALYHGPAGVDYFMLMAREGDAWKVAAISPTEFPSSG